MKLRGVFAVVAVMCVHGADGLPAWSGEALRNGWGHNQCAAGGRRVRQGLVYRSSGLNNNAKGIYYTYDEIKQLEADGKLAGMGPLGAKYSAKLKAGKKLDKRYLRLKKPRPSEPGTARLTEEWRDYMSKKLGIKTDIHGVREVVRQVRRRDPCRTHPEIRAVAWFHAAGH